MAKEFIVAQTHHDKDIEDEEPEYSIKLSLPRVVGDHSKAHHQDNQGDLEDYE
jgi:hypothetical protein